MFRTLLAAVLLAVPSLALAEPPGGTLLVDPVELVEGRETKGEATIFVDRDNYRYVFIDEASKARFLSAPDRYEIQMGGACARMGPLSGRGRADLFAVHNDHIYIFASEGCKATFLKNAERMVETADERPSFTPEAEARAMALLDQALAAHGAERIDNLRNIVAFSSSEQTTNAGVSKVTSTLTIVFGEMIATKDTWDEHEWGYVASPADAFTYSSRGAESLSESQILALGRIAVANPVALLRARVHPEFIAGALGAGTIGETPVERVAVWFHGFAATVAIDPDSGRILAITCKDRGPAMMLGQLERRFADFRDSNGALLPQRVEVLFDGEPWPEKSGPVQWTADAPLDMAEFVRAKAL